MHLHHRTISVALALPLVAYHASDAMFRCFGCASLVAWRDPRLEWPAQPDEQPTYDTQPATRLSIRTTEVPPDQFIFLPTIPSTAKLYAPSITTD